MPRSPDDQPVKLGDISQSTLLEIERWMSRTCAAPVLADVSVISAETERLKLAEKIGRASVLYDIRRELAVRKKEAQRADG